MFLKNLYFTLLLLVPDANDSDSDDDTAPDDNFPGLWIIFIEISC